MSPSEQSESNQSAAANRINLAENSIKNSTDSNKYPAAKVIKTFALLGGILGGLMIWFGLTVIFPAYILDMFMYIIPSSIVTGFIPSVITALIINRLRLILNEPVKWFYLFAVGATVSAIYAFIIMIMLSMFLGGIHLLVDYSQDVQLFTLLLSVIGGVCSLILGSFVLPKTKKDPFN